MACRKRERLGLDPVLSPLDCPPFSTETILIWSVVISLSWPYWNKIIKLLSRPTYWKINTTSFISPLLITKLSLYSISPTLVVTIDFTPIFCLTHLFYLLSFHIYVRRLVCCTWCADIEGLFLSSIYILSIIWACCWGLGFHCWIFSNKTNKPKNVPTIKK